LRNLAEVREVVGAVKRPFNVVTGWLDPDITAADLAEAGARRISVGGALSRLALATFAQAGRAMKEQGSFAWMRDMASIADLSKLYGAGAPA
jgi:2-methylisocitrate lyase-like PEP mutase family enzyme